jgi:hypothetical protein
MTRKGKAKALQASVELQALVQGHSLPFKVVPPTNYDLFDLQRLVKEMYKPRLDDVAANELIIWKVNSFYLTV